MVSMILYPFDAATAARPMPVLPLVGSIMTAPGFNTPLCSASSIIAFAILSFTLPAGLKYSSFASILAFAPSFSANLLSSAMGVLPTKSKKPFLMSAIMSLPFI